jgi:hypothetical protein
MALFYAFETKVRRQQFLDILKEHVALFHYCKSSRQKHENARRGDEEHEMNTPAGGGDPNRDHATSGTQDHMTAGPPTSPSEPEDGGLHSVNNVVLGTALLWIGWYGFNGGSALGGNLRAVSAIASTHVAACAGGCAYLIAVWFLNSRAEKHPVPGYNPYRARELSIIEFCNGVVIALVAITPAAGYVRLQRDTCKLTFADRTRFPCGALQSSVWCPASLSSC